MNDKFKIHLEIAGRKYPLNIRREDEEIVRQAAALVNKELATYREQFGKDKSKSIYDFLAMTAIDLSHAYLRLRETRDVEIFTGIVREIDEELDSYLNQK